jgi:hypothetical protein
MGGFKRSGLFGLVGVFVVAALIAVIALTTGGGEANPKLTLGLIFAVLAVFLAILFALQRADLNRASGADARASDRAASEAGLTVEDPTALDEASLWRAMAVTPVTAEAERARSSGWEAGRRSQNLAIVVVILIFLTVPAIYLTESFVPLLIGGPAIAIAAIYGSLRAVGPGGEMDRGYERLGIAMEPLGLEVAERPKVGIEMRDPVTPRMGPKIRGVLELSGERHGHSVTVRLGGGEVRSRSEVRVAVSARPFAATSRKVEVESGPEGILIVRKGGAQGDWLCDLWVAERLAQG